MYQSQEQIKTSQDESECPFGNMDNSQELSQSSEKPPWKSTQELEEMIGEIIDDYQPSVSSQPHYNSYVQSVLEEAFKTHSHKNEGI